MGQVLAAQREHQHSAGIGVADQRSQQLAGLGMVMAGLGAAEGMGEGVQAVDGAGDQILVVPHEGFGAVVDAADGGDDPDLVADGGTAVLAAVAHESLRGRRDQWMYVGMVAVLDLAGQVGLDVVGVHPGAGHGVSGGMADGEAVLDDILACLDGSDGHLVALGDILNSGDGGVIHGDSGALGDGVQGNDHVIFGVDLNSDGHNKTISLI